MAGNLSNWAEENILKLSVGKAAWTNTNVYAALYTTAPGDSTSGTEVSGTGYARVQVSNGTNSVFGNTYTSGSSTGIKNDGTYNATSSGLAGSGSGIITFPQATASWGVVTAVALLDNSTGGNIIWYGTLTNSKTVDANDTVSFAAGDLQLTID